MNPGRILLCLIILVALLFSAVAANAQGPGDDLRRARTRASAGPIVNVSRTAGNHQEASVAINPTNPNNVVIVSNTELSPGGLMRAYSTDGGATWTRSIIGTGGSDPLGVACCDPTLSWDQFGNLFLGYLDDTATDVMLAVSTDGGVTFSLVNGGVVATPLPRDPSQPATQTRAGTDVDQPTVTTGPGEMPGQGSVWVTYETGNNIHARGAPVTGLGAIGAFNADQLVPGSTGGNFGDIAVGPNGQVLVTYQIPSGGQGPATIFTNLDPDGLGASGFNAAILATTTNVGGFDFIPAQPDRSIDAEAGLAYDRSGGTRNGRVYLVYTDESVNENDDTDILVRFSDNDGTTWSAPVHAEDEIGNNSQFLPRIKVDPTTGKVGVSWHDARFDNGQNDNVDDYDGVANNDANFFATFSNDGGATFQTNIVITPKASDEDGSEPPGAGYLDLDYGDYTGLDYMQGVMRPAWADNSNSTGDNPDGTLNQMDVYSVAIRTDVADLGITMTDSPDPVTAGTDLSYTITVTNHGPDPAVNVQMSDTVPANTTFVSLTQDSGPTFTCMTPSSGGTGMASCSISTLAAGASASFTLIVHVPSSTPEGSTISNTATISSSTTDPGPNPNSDTETTGVITRADLRINKTYSVSGFAGAGNITYKITIRNNGPSDAQNVTMTDALDPTTTLASASATGGGMCTGNPTVTCTWPTIPAGRKRVVTIVAQLKPEALHLCNTAKVSSSTTDPNPSNNSRTVCLTVPTQADLRTVKRAQVGATGRQILYTIRVTNAGPSVARDVKLRDALANSTSLLSVATTVGTCSGTRNVHCSFGDVYPGTTIVVKIRVRLIESVPSVRNTATATSTTSDPDGSNNSGTVEVLLSGSLQLHSEREIAQVVMQPGANV